MNPVFVFLVILGAVLLWLSLTIAFKGVGIIAKDIAKSVKRTIEDDDDEEEAETNEKE